MLKVKLGRTGITVNKNGFGALPVQRRSVDDAVQILRKAYQSGINYYDTARMYTDSEYKLGLAFEKVRKDVILATKTMAETGEGVEEDLAKSLEMLKTDYIDVYQLHNPSFCPVPGDDSGIYSALEKAKTEGKIRHIGLTNHRLHVAKQAVESGLYDILQFPFSYLAGEEEKSLVDLCKKHDVGFVAMKSLAGGLLQDAAAAYAFMAEQENVLPIWGIQFKRELDEFLSFQKDPPTMTEKNKEVIEKDREMLSGSFCRGCGYCMPCPMDIQINNCARMSLMLRRAVAADWLTETWQKEMKKIEDCIECGQCASRCPYGLDTPQLLKENYEDYKTFLTK